LKCLYQLRELLEQKKCQITSFKNAFIFRSFYFCGRQLRQGKNAKLFEFHTLRTKVLNQNFIPAWQARRPGCASPVAQEKKFGLGILLAIDQNWQLGHYNFDTG
jgi:hypothetical protein